MYLAQTISKKRFKNSKNSIQQQNCKKISEQSKKIILILKQPIKKAQISGKTRFTHLNTQQQNPQTRPKQFCQKTYQSLYSLFTLTNVQAPINQVSSFTRNRYQDST